MKPNDRLKVLEYLYQYWGDRKYYDIELLLGKEKPFRRSHEYRKIIQGLKQGDLIRQKPLTGKLVKKGPTEEYEPLQARMSLLGAREWEAHLRGPLLASKKSRRVNPIQMEDNIINTKEGSHSNSSHALQQVFNIITASNREDRSGSGWMDIMKLIVTLGILTLGVLTYLRGC